MPTGDAFRDPLLASNERLMTLEKEEAQRLTERERERLEHRRDVHLRDVKALATAVEASSPARRRPGKAVAIMLLPGWLLLAVLALQTGHELVLAAVSATVCVLLYYFVYRPGYRLRRATSKLGRVEEQLAALDQKRQRIEVDAAARNHGGSLDELQTRISELEERHQEQEVLRTRAS